MLIRPTVLPTPEVASKFAAEERNRLSGVKQGERDLRIEEEERYRKIEEQLRKDDEIRKAREVRDAKTTLGSTSDPSLSIPKRQLVYDEQAGDDAGPVKLEFRNSKHEQIRISK